MTIKINNEGIRIRPSAIDTFYGCAYQWGKSHLEGISSIPNSRAAIGTAIHKGIEVSWREAMKSGKADHNISMMVDAAVEEFKEETKEGISFGRDETKDTCISEVREGLSAWKSDIAGFLTIPKAVETFFEVKVTHPLVDSVGGTIDYLTDGVIDDVKTSKRTVTPSSYSTQQSVYKMLAEANGETIKHNRLQNVVLTKQPKGAILTLEPDVGQAKTLINGMLDVLELVHKDVVPIEMLLRGNPKYMFCSEAYCAHYDNCPWVKGDVKPARKADIAAIKL